MRTAIRFKAVQQQLRTDGIRRIAELSPPLDLTEGDGPAPAAPAPARKSARKPDEVSAPVIEEAQIVEEAPFIHAETPDLFGGENIVQMAPKPQETPPRKAHERAAASAVPLPLDLPPLPTKMPKALAVSRIRPTPAQKARLAGLQQIRALPYDARIEDSNALRLTLAKLQHLRDRLADALG